MASWAETVVGAGGGVGIGAGGASRQPGPLQGFVGGAGSASWAAWPGERMWT
jgi:hypothetical protein